MMAASRASVLASPACKSAIQRIASPGRYPTRMPSERVMATCNAPMVAGWSTTSSIWPCCFRSDISDLSLFTSLGKALSNRRLPERLTATA